MIKPCNFCGNPFETRASRHKFCSLLCLCESHIVRQIVGCWAWDGAKSHGYAVFSCRDENKNNKVIFAHRFYYEMTVGPIADGLYVLHKCDNPECMKPDHLFLGTQKDNMLDCIEKGRHSLPPVRARGPFGGAGNWKRGSAHYAARLTEAQVREIRHSKERGVNLAARFKVTEQAISVIRRGRSWKHVV